MTIEKRYQIFLSSTYEDLIKARVKVIETILSLYHFPVGMEMFSADDEEQWQTIKETIRMSDYYVLVIGHRYGSETSNDISFTEKEYDYALEQGIPILAFIRKRDVATKPQERDDAPLKIEKLNNFIAKATKNKMCNFWEDENELTTKVAIALLKAFRKNPRIGWIRADKSIVPEVSEELSKLSKENRELRKEAETLNAKIENKKPYIKVSLNGKEKLDILFKNEKKMKLTRLEYPKPIDYREVTEYLKPYLSLEDVKRYNLSLPSKEEIDYYNNNLEYYWRFTETGENLLIGIFNQGSSKAHEIFVEIEFPKELVITNKEKLSELSPPQNPIPMDPIAKAMEKYEADKVEKVNAVIGGDVVTGKVSIIRNIFTRESQIRREHWSEIEGNKVTIELDNLLHTRRKHFDYILIPLKAGKFELKASVICEEYMQKDDFYFPINVFSENGSSQ